jgi:hypothetical protein
VIFGISAAGTIWLCGLRPKTEIVLNFFIAWLAMSMGFSSYLLHIVKICYRLSLPVLTASTQTWAFTHDILVLFICLTYLLIGSMMILLYLAKTNLVVVFGATSACNRSFVDVFFYLTKTRSKFRWKNDQ